MRQVRASAGSDLTLRSFGFAKDAKPQDDTERLGRFSGGLWSEV